MRRAEGTRPWFLRTDARRMRYVGSSSAPARTGRGFLTSVRDCCAILRRANQVLPHGLYTEMTVAAPSMSRWATDKEIRRVGADALPRMVTASAAGPAGA